MKPARILIVDDSVVVRRLLHGALQDDPDFEPVGVAANGRLALDRIERLRPDAVILDVEMPVLNGIDTLRAIRSTNRHLPVVMFSALTKQGAKESVAALVAGATDCATKPSGCGNREEALAHVRTDLLPKLRRILRPEAIRSDALPAPRQRSLRPRRWRPRVLAIGSSTGGPNALARLIADLGTDFPLPIAITQHMPPLFSRMLAERLDTLTDLEVREAQDGAVLEPRRVLVAAGDYHLRFRRTNNQVVATLDQGPQEHSCRPAVDVMFRSLVELYGGDLIAVVLTGMGQDGARGAKTIRELGGHVVAQDEASSVVWGMPGSVVAAGAAHEVLPLTAIAGRLRTLVQPRLKSTPSTAVQVSR